MTDPFNNIEIQTVDYGVNGYTAILYLNKEQCSSRVGVGKTKTEAIGNVIITHRDLIGLVLLEDQKG